MRALLCIILLALLDTSADALRPVVGGAGFHAGCQVSLVVNTTRPQKEAARFFSGYNQVLGMFGSQNVTYDNEPVHKSLDLVPVGFLRFPGGTVANLWNFTSADQVVPCSLGSVGVGKNFSWLCESAQVNTQLRPPQTYSVKNFFGNISKPHLVGGYAENMVYDFNLYTMPSDELNASFDALLAEVPNELINYIELGNEYYLHSYSAVFPTGDVYMEKALPFAAYIKSKLPNVKISVPCGSHGQLRGYNAGLVAKWNSSLINYVTFHDYSAGMNFDRYHQPSDIPEKQLLKFLNYGQYTIPKYRGIVNSLFTQNGHPGVGAFNTEFDVAIKKFNTLDARMAMRGIFALNFQTAGFCDPDRLFEMNLLHVMWGGGPAQATTVQLDQDDLEHGATSYTAVSQLLAQVGTLGLKNNANATCLDFSDIFNEGCGGQQEVEGFPVQCMAGVSFWTEGSDLVFYVSNACNYTHKLSLPVKGVFGSSSQAQPSLKVEQWHYYFTHKFDSESHWATFEGRCEGTLWEASDKTSQTNDKKCHVVNPTKEDHHINATGDVGVAVYGLSAVVVRIQAV